MPKFGKKNSEINFIKSAIEKRERKSNPTNKMLKYFTAFFPFISSKVIT